MGITRHLRSASDHAVRVAGLGVLTGWHLRSQETARRNAMVASTELAQRRFEREEVEEFLAQHRRRHDARAAHAAG